MKNQVVTLPEAKKLDPLLPKEFETVKRWWRRRHKGMFDKPDFWGEWFVDDSGITIEAGNESFAAPMIEEVLKIIPNFINLKKCSITGCIYQTSTKHCTMKAFLNIEFCVDVSYIGYICETESHAIVNIICDPAEHTLAKKPAKNLATAASMIYRWLKEKAHV